MRLLCFPLALLASAAFAQPILRLEIANRGSIDITLNESAAPKTVAQIIRLARSGFYDGQAFFRVERTPRPYLAWFGDPASKTSDDLAKLGNGGSGRKVPFEANDLRHVKGAVGLARPLDDKNGGDSVFYIALDEAKFLDGRYTVFGRVTAGMEILSRLSKGDKVVRATVLN